MTTISSKDAHDNNHSSTVNSKLHTLKLKSNKPTVPAHWCKVLGIGFLPFSPYVCPKPFRSRQQWDMCSRRTINEGLPPSNNILSKCGLCNNFLLSSFCNTSFFMSHYRPSVFMVGSCPEASGAPWHRQWGNDTGKWRPQCYQFWHILFLQPVIYIVVKQI